MHAIHTPRRARGFGLIEALVAMAVLSIGLVGLARLQTAGLRASHTATLRMVAVEKAIEIVERMRANPLGVVDAAGNSSYDLPAGSATVDAGCADTAAAAAAICTPAQIAAHDYRVWTTDLTRAFPNMSPSGAIDVRTDTTPPTVTVTVNWTERGRALNYTTVQQL
jgi:type IV pilus assembly protein PilV